MKRALIFLALLAIPATSHAQQPSITLHWTAPGDDGIVGTATTYEMRYRSVAPDTTSQATILTWWNAATIVAGLPAPLIAGTTQTVTASPTGGFASGQTYYFIMRTADERPNWSLFSNVVAVPIVDIAAPERIQDLRNK